MILLLTLLSTWQSLSAQYNIQKFDINDGLATNVIVFGIVQDRHGYMWFNHADALSRFDGYHFEVYTGPAFDPPAGKLLLDPSGNLWIAPRYLELPHALVQYDITTDTFFQYTFDLAKQFNLINPYNGLKQERIGPTLIEQNGDVAWFGSFFGQGIFRYDIRTDSIEHYYHHHTDSVSRHRQNVIRAIRDYDTHLLLGTLRGLWSFDKKTKAFTRPAVHPSDSTRLYQHNMLAFPSPSKHGTSEMTDSFWMTIGVREEPGVQVIKLEDGLSITQMFHFPTVTASYNISFVNDMFWFHTEQGIRRFDPSDSSEITLNQFENLPVIEDREGNLWTTSDGAMQIIEPYLSFVTVQGAGGEKGFSMIYDSSNEQFLVNSGHSSSIIKLPKDSLSLSVEKQELPNLSGALYQGRKYLWSTGNESQLLGYSWSPSTGTFISEVEIALPDRLTWIQSIWEDDAGVLWVTRGPDGLTKIVLDSMQQSLVSTEHYVRDSDDSSTIRDGNVYMTIPENDSAFWVVAGSGLDLFYPDLDQFRHIADFKAPKLHKGDDGNLYVASEKTLFRGERDQGNYQFVPIHETQGFIFDLEQDGMGRLWMRMSNGLSVYDPVENINFEFGPKDGLKIASHFKSAMHRTDQGYIVLVDPEGTSIFDPMQLEYDRAANPPLITDLHVNNNPVHIGSDEGGRKFVIPLNISVSESLTLDHLHNNFSLEFSAMHLGSPKKILYRYMLDGYDDDWIETNWEGRTASYMNLSAGWYTFRLKSSSPFGIWSEEETSLLIRVLPPPWRTWWAYTIYILLLMGGLYGFYRWRTRQTYLKLEQERAVNAQLKRLDQLKDQFLANTSHELRTPLNGIIGIAESLKDGIAGQLPKKAHTNLHVIISSGKRLASLVNDVLDFSKLKNQDIVLNLRPVDMYSAVDVVLTLSEPIIRLRELKMINSIPRDVPLVMADENRVQQILHNLVGNAIKFTERGQISVSAKVVDGALEVSVADTGIGIPEDKYDSIFLSFEQADGSTAREYGGTGLGLSVTKQLVELHGGRIWLDSKVGEGSNFHFTLPVSKETRDTLPGLEVMEDEPIVSAVLTENAAEDSEVTAAVSAAEDVARILIVDDEPVNLQVLENHLTLAGYEVTQAINGREALEIVKNEIAFDLIILDIMMPNMSGYEVCHKLRNNYLPGELPVIMLTAKNRVADLVEGFSVGANDYLTKPFSRDELLSRIKTHLNLHRIHRSTGKFVPFEFLHAVGRESITEVRLGDHTQKDVTVFFSDMRDFTALSEQMTPEENFQFINEYVGAMGPIVRKHRGFINQYQGDGIMAIFPKQFQYALQAAIEMQIKVQEMNLTSAYKLAVGIGLHAGPLIMGIIGDEKRNEPTTIADTVNTAARMEGLTKHYGAQIVVTENCLNSLEETNRYHFRYLGKVQVKGKKQALGAYECFDGDLPHVRDLKLKELDSFEEGMKNYYAREFADAAAIFNDIVKSNPDDHIAEYFRNRSAQYTITGVPNDWVGVERLEKK